MTACCDSGPFIHLAQIDLLNVFSLFHELLTTPQVIAEISQGNEKHIRDIVAWENIRMQNVSRNDIQNLQDELKKYKLQKTELGILCLNVQNRIPLFLTDDLEAREAAQILGLQPHGSVGLIVRACHVKLIPFKQAEKGLNDLYEESSLFVTRSIIEMALQKLREST